MPCQTFHVIPLAKTSHRYSCGKAICPKNFFFIFLCLTSIILISGDNRFMELGISTY